MKAVRTDGDNAPGILNPAFDGFEWPDSNFCQFIPATHSVNQCSQLLYIYMKLLF
jgi:hypothetical protein